jgi:hypothetical protein
MLKIRSLDKIYQYFYLPKEILENISFFNCSYKMSYNYPEQSKGISISNKRDISINVNNHPNKINIYSFVLDLDYSKNNGYQINIFVSFDQSLKEAQASLFNNLVNFYTKEKNLENIRFLKQFNSFDKKFISLKIEFDSFKDGRTFDFDFFTFQRNFNSLYFDTYPHIKGLPPYLSEYGQQKLYDDLHELHGIVENLNKEEFCKLIKNVYFEEGRYKITEELEEHLILLYKQ